MDAPRPLDTDLSDVFPHGNGQEVNDNLCKPVQKPIGAVTDKGGGDERTSNLNGATNELNCTEPSSVNGRGNSFDQCTHLPDETDDRVCSSQSRPWRQGSDSRIADYDGHSCVQYVERYCNESSQNKILWGREDYIDGQVKIRRIHRAKRKRARNCIIDLD